ncbi:MAG: zinc ribbon domain-containing protein [Acidobacteria bacterium]|nr:zinc ribbon domain-containing protein [Acidobacteriota bacterium]
MPLYEYRCGCGAAEEAIESFSAPTEHACKACGDAQGMKRQLSASGFVLSGGGWYASGYGQGDGKPKPEGKAAGDSTPAKAESAPATPAPASGCGGGCACH